MIIHFQKVRMENLRNEAIINEFIDRKVFGYWFGLPMLLKKTG